MLSIPKTNVKREKKKEKKNESKANPIQSSHDLRGNERMWGIARRMKIGHTNQSPRRKPV